MLDAGNGNGAATAATWFAERLAELTRSAGSSAARVAVLDTGVRRRGEMTPLHAHEHDEAYRVTEGEVVFYVGDEVVLAGAGDVVVAPRGVPRTFRVVSDTARWLVITAARSVARYDDFLRAVAEPRGPSWAWTSADEAAALAAIARQGGIAVLGPPGMLPNDLARG